jgi:Domain of unknown function (DUF4375)
MFHIVSILLVSEEEKRDLLLAGVEFKRVERTNLGESVTFELEEDDPRWPAVLKSLASIKGNNHLPKERRIRYRSATVPWEEIAKRVDERLAALKTFARSLPGNKWLNGYSGESVDELLSLEGQYRTDSLVLAFEEAITQKVERDGLQSMTLEERTVLTIEALEREVNNGGYDQFFRNSSVEFSPLIVESLKKIGCKKTANITQRAIKALDLADLTAHAIKVKMTVEDEDRAEKLRRCDNAYYAAAEPIAKRLFAFIKATKANIRF